MRPDYSVEIKSGIQKSLPHVISNSIYNDCLECRALIKTASNQCPEDGIYWTQVSLSHFVG